MKIKTENKLLNFFREVEKNKHFNNQSRNERLILNFFRQELKTPIIFYESDWTAGSPIATFQTMRKGNEVPQYIDVEFDLELSIPETFLPYLQPNIYFKTLSGVEIEGMRSYSLKNYSGDFIFVKGDGSLLFSSSGTTVRPFDTVSDANASAFLYTKKAFKATFSEIGYAGYVEEIDWERTISGTTYTFESLIRTTTTHELTVIDENSFTCIGTYTTDNGIDPPVIENNVEKTLNWGDADSYDIKIFNYNIALDQVDTTSHADPVLTENTFTDEGSWTFYTSDKEIPVSYIKNSNDVELHWKPSNNEHTAITLERNPEGYPVTAVSSVSDGEDSSKDFVILRLNEGSPSVPPTYVMKFSSRTYFSAPAIQADVPSITDTTVQDDAYTWNGSIYTRTTNNESYKSDAYQSAGDDVEYKILVILNNPLNYNQLRRYEIK